MILQISHFLLMILERILVVIIHHPKQRLATMVISRTIYNQ